MLGTKRPSMTSTWIQSQPALSIACTCSPSLEKLALQGAQCNRGAEAGPNQAQEERPESSVPSALVAQDYAGVQGRRVAQQARLRCQASAGMRQPR